MIFRSDGSDHLRLLLQHHLPEPRKADQDLSHGSPLGLHCLLGPASRMLQIKAMRCHQHLARVLVLSPPAGLCKPSPMLLPRLPKPTRAYFHHGRPCLDVLHLRLRLALMLGQLKLKQRHFLSLQLRPGGLALMSQWVILVAFGDDPLRILETKRQYFTVVLVVVNFLTESAPCSHRLQAKIGETKAHHLQEHCNVEAILTTTRVHLHPALQHIS